MALARARAYGHVMFIGGTYKTDEYRMQRFHIVFMASTDDAFTVAYGRLHTEFTERYTRALVKPLTGPEVHPRLW